MGIGDYMPNILYLSSTGQTLFNLGYIMHLIIIILLSLKSQILSMGTPSGWFLCSLNTLPLIVTDLLFGKTACSLPALHLEATISPRSPDSVSGE